MSTTNPDSGGLKADPVGGLAPIAPGSRHGDDHDISGPPSPATIARGHEEDRYDAISVFSVPFLVVLFFVLAFSTTTLLFYFLAPSVPHASESQQAEERNKAPLNERLARIGRGKEVDQPRLEDLKLREGNARAITRPETPDGNSPFLHAEDLRPTPGNMPQLFETKWLDANKTVGRISITDAMAMADKLFPVRQHPEMPRDSANMPTAANAGRPVPPQPSGGAEKH